VGIDEVISFGRGRWRRGGRGVFISPELVRVIVIYRLFILRVTRPRFRRIYRLFTLRVSRPRFRRIYRLFILRVTKARFRRIYRLFILRVTRPRLRFRRGA